MMDMKSIKNQPERYFRTICRWSRSKTVPRRDFCSTLRKNCMIMSLRKITSIKRLQKFSTVNSHRDPARGRMNPTSNGVTKQVKSSAHIITMSHIFMYPAVGSMRKARFSESAWWMRSACCCDGMSIQFSFPCFCAMPFKSIVRGSSSPPIRPVTNSITLAFVQEKRQLFFLGLDGKSRFMLLLVFDCSLPQNLKICRTDLKFSLPLGELPLIIFIPSIPPAFGEFKASSCPENMFAPFGLTPPSGFAKFSFACPPPNPPRDPEP
mmetsp:Transcript_538/g.1102  ORF Transcript_538/g.1102 Transcript_538/m.1102 type:complete len:265 (-) Transcript_538:625-1419(-)